MNVQGNLFDDGEHRKADGIERALAGAVTWVEMAKLAALWIGAQRTTFTSEDITGLIGLPRTSVGTNKNNAVGAVMSALANASMIRRHSVTKSKNPQGHSAIITCWTLTERGKARAALLVAEVELGLDPGRV